MIKISSNKRTRGSKGIERARREKNRETDGESELKRDREEGESK